MIESVQYNAALAIAIRGSSREKLYQELGLESLHDSKEVKQGSYDRQWYR